MEVQISSKITSLRHSTEDMKMFKDVEYDRAICSLPFQCTSSNVEESKKVLKALTE